MADLTQVQLDAKTLARLAAMSPTEQQAELRRLDAEIFALEQETLRRRKRVVAEARQSVGLAGNLLDLYGVSQPLGFLDRASRVLRFEDSRLHPRPAPLPPPEPIETRVAEAIAHEVERQIRSLED